MIERSRRHRILTEAEIALWVAVARTVTPRPEAFLPKPKPLPPTTTPEPAPRESAPPAGALAPHPPATPPRKPQPPPLAPFEKRYRRQVTSGQVTIEAAIDLHGLNQAEAHHVLHDFLRSAHGRGVRLVLVVTGKGRARISPGGFSEHGEPGVLRRAVPAWLREEALRGVVLGFEEAGLPHGGGGALYIRLRRRTR